ncbi:MAG TPA: class IV adenylate cyclase [Methanoregulaceae archaeon]|nr:class IV adenylate cyclase [Methanoregulaceae archaeon]
MIEFELKARVDTLSPIRDALVARQARLDGSRREHDRYYNHPCRDFGVTDEALRVRRAGTETVITYKGAKMTGTRLKAREELNLVIEDGTTFEEILQRLGFRLTAEVIKHRELWSLGEASIALDEVEGLGTFAEVEMLGERDDTGTEDRIHTLARSLGITGKPITTSYMELVMAQNRHAPF